MKNNVAWIVVVLMLTSCLPAVNNSITSTPSPSHTLQPTATVTPTFTSTPTPTKTNTPTPILPVNQGTPVPQDLQPITPKNATNIKILRVLEIETLRYLEIHEISFSPDGNTIVASISHTNRYEGMLRFWDITTGMPLETNVQGAHFAFSPDGSLLATFCTSCESYSCVFFTEVWQIYQGLPYDRIWRDAGNRRPPMIFSKNGRELITGTEGKEMRIWNSSNGMLIQSVKKGIVGAFSPDLSLFTTTPFYGGGTYFRKFPSGELAYPYKLDIHFGNVFSPDGQLYVGQLYGQPPEVLRISDGTPLYLINAPSNTPCQLGSAAFSPDGQILVIAAFGCDKAAYLYRVSDGSLINTLEISAKYKYDKDTPYPYRNMSIIFSPDGKMLAIAYHDLIETPGEIQLWGVP